MKVFSLIFVFVLCCIFCMQTEAASRTRRADDTLDELQKKFSEGFDSVRKAAEEMASKLDLKQLQSDFSAKLDELAKSFTNAASSAPKNADPAE